MKECPNCKSKNVEMTGVNRGVPTLGDEIPLTNLLGYKCKDCGNLFDVQI